MSNMNEKKVVLESIAVMQRILAKLVTEDKVSEDDVKTLTTICNKIDQLIKEGSTSTEIPPIEVDATKYLENLGIPKKIKGYQYLRYAIILRFERGDEMEGFIKNLYLEVAKEFQTTPKRVERAIRHAIEGSWNKGYFKKQSELFGNPVKRPTNSEFIAIIVDDMKLRRLK